LSLTRRSLRVVRVKWPVALWQNLGEVHVIGEIIGGSGFRPGVSCKWAFEVRLRCLSYTWCASRDRMGVLPPPLIGADWRQVGVATWG
jgi:hypothetical protein